MQAPFAEHLEHVVASLSDHVARTTKGEGSAKLRERAMRTFSELIGALTLTLARAVAVANPELSDEILAATRKAIR